MLLKMAFKNMFRHKKRTFLTMSVLVFGIYLAIFYDGILKGFIEDAVKTYITTDIGRYKIYGENYFKEREDNDQIEFLLEEDKIKEMLADEPFSIRLSFNGTVGNGENEIPVKFLGVYKEQENSIFQRDESILSGVFLENEDSVVVGSGVAEALGVKLGDDITIVGRTVNKSINAYDMKIDGIIKTKNNLIDEGTVFLDINFAKKFLKTEQINDVVVMSELNENKVKIMKKSADVISYEEELEDIIELMKFKGKASNAISYLILLMAAVGIANTMLMAMFEREKEIGVLMAMGMGNSRIVLLFVMEGFLIGVLGSGIGLILGLITNSIVSAYGIPLPVEMYKEMGIEMLIPEKMFAVVDLNMCLNYFLIGVVVATIASFYAAFKATKYNPIEIMRN